MINSSLNVFNEDFKDFINCLNQSNVKYILVSGYSVILHGYHRTTGDIDLWVEVSELNYSNLQNSFLHFGIPVSAIDKSDFLTNDNFDVFTFGRPPMAIDIIKKIKGLSFEETYKNAQDIKVDGIKIKLIHYNHLIQSKKAAGRYKDLDDIENLNKNNNSVEVSKRPF
jgi:hypothetical protein